jgi:acyl-CoA dehydrogenase
MDITDAAGRRVDPIADSPERAELRAALRQLIMREAPPDRIRRLDEAEEFDEHLYGKLAEFGALGIDAPTALGGSGDVRDQLVVIEELAAGPTSMAAFMIVQYMIIQVLGAFASTDEQRAVLADLVRADTKVSFSLSESDGGTDVARVMKTRAARTGEAVRSSIDGVSMFLVPTSAAGVAVRPIDTLGIHGLSTCEVFFDEVALSPDALIGGEGAGFRQAFSTLNREGIIACAASLGVGRGALEFLVNYTSERQVFGKPIGSFQVPQHWMVDGAVQLEAARSLMVRAAEVELGGGKANMLALSAKLIASEAAQTIALKGMQLMGGFGYSRELPMQRWFRDVRLWSFAPLNNEMVRNQIGERLLGLPRSY